MTCTVTAAFMWGRHGRGRSGASSSAGRARRPDTVIRWRQRAVFFGDAARESGWSRIIDGIRDLGAADRARGGGHGRPESGPGAGQRAGGRAGHLAAARGRRGRGPAPRAHRRRDRGRHPAVRRLPRCTEKPGGCSPAHWMAGVTRWSSPARSGPRRRTAVAQKIQTPLIDDIDGSAAEGTVPVRAGRHRL